MIGALFWGNPSLKDYERQAVLFVNGSFDSTDLLVENIKNCFVVAVDGGLKHCQTIGVEPQLLVGDFDSVNSALLEKYNNVKKIFLPKDKDETDLEYSLKLLDFSTYERVTILGGFGGRSDHLMGNFNLLTRYPGKVFLESKDACVFAVNLSNGTVTVASHPGQTISLYPMNGPAVGITTSHLKWELKDSTLDKNFVGQSNQALAESFTIQVKQGDLLCFLNFST